MKKLLYHLTGIAAIAMVFFCWVPVADAHPLGNFTINHYAGLQVAPDEVGIDYVLDMAEIPAFQEINRLDTNRNHQAEPSETVNYPRDKCQEINSHLELRINQQPVALEQENSAIAFPPGVGGLSTLRLTCNFHRQISSQSDRASLFGDELRIPARSVSTNQLIEFEDKFYPQRLGWREITVKADGVPVQGNFTSASISKRLTEYPNDLLSSPLNQRQIAVEINPPAQLSQQAPQSPQLSSHLGNALTGRNNDVFTQLITLKEYNLPTILIALAIAFVWGGLHALSPGHGKTVVGAYLVGAKSKPHHALFLGLTVTLTHTASIFALGLLTLGTSGFILTEQWYPWLSLLSGLLVTGIGLNLFISRLRSSQVFQNRALEQHQARHPHHHGHHHHEHGHEHNHDHSHELAKTHNHEHVHAHHHHTHDHNHEHTHGLHSHSHLPPGADGSPITWASLLALGVSGGLLPCPSALVVLLSAIALGRVGLGLALVSAFSLGLAGVLTGLGLLLVYTKELFEQLPIQLPKISPLPTVSALFITLIGLGLTTQAWFAHLGQ